VSGDSAGETRECLCCSSDADSDDGLCAVCRERERPYRPRPTPAAGAAFDDETRCLPVWEECALAFTQRA
jgi:hypothetical protein